jgi:hypothetical protein
MPVKREHQRNGVVLPRISDGLPDDLLMTEMNAVKNADGEAGFTAAGLQVFGGMDDLHDLEVKQVTS